MAYVKRMMMVIKRVASVFIWCFALLLMIMSCQKEDDLKINIENSLYYPRGQEILVVEGSFELRWNISNCEKVDIWLKNSEGDVVLIEEALLNKNKYLWKINEDIDTGIDYVIEIVDNLNANQYVRNTTPFQIIPNGESSTFTDPRDGNIYNTVKIGTQTWMAENFRYNEGEGSYYYLDDEHYYENYGKLYSLEAAEALCPKGWHLPSDEEWQQLELYIGIPENELFLEGDRGSFSGELLKIDKGLGFNTIYAGYRNDCVNRYGHHLYEAHFWTSSRDRNNNAIIRVLIDGKGSIMRLGSICHGGSSVRYIKDKDE